MIATRSAIVRRIVFTTIVLVGLAIPPAAPGVENHATVQAQDGSSLCAAKAGGLPLVNSSEWRPDDDYSQATCVYARDKPTHRSISAKVYWHDLAAVGVDGSEMTARFCDLGEAGESSRLFTKFDNNGIDLSRLGVRRVYAEYNFIPANKRGAARKLAARLIKAVEGKATACPDATTDVGDGQPSSVELVLTGPRLQALRDAGGIGVLIGLEGDESYGLVLTDSAGVPVNVQDFVGRRGRVVEMGVSLIGEDGEEVVSVTVEVVPDDPVVAVPSAEPDGGVDPNPIPSDPPTRGVDDEPDGTEPRPAEDDVPPSPSPSPSAEPVGDDSATVQVADLIERVEAQLEAIQGAGGGVVILDSGDLAPVAALVGDAVSSVRLRPGKLEVVPISSKWGKLFFYPELDRATGKVSVKIKFEPPGDFGLVEIPVNPDLLAKTIPGAARQIELALEAVNAEIRDRGLRPTSIFLDENGIAVEVETTP